MLHITWVVGCKELPELNVKFEISEIVLRQNFVKIKKLNICWLKIIRFGDLDVKCLKANVRIEISTFAIEYRQNVFNISNLILFDPKYPYLRIWAQNLQKSMSDLKSAHFKKTTCKILLKLKN